MSLPEELYYTKDHEWISAKSGTIAVGVTAYAVEQLGDIVHIELPEVGDVIEGGSSFGTIESTKTVSDLYIPADGKVVEVNSEVIKHPEIVGEDPYDKGWLIKVKLLATADNVLDAEEYNSYISEE